jgi:hypothetical protein
MYDRFDLEEEIHKVWSTEEDLETILYRIMDAPEEHPSEDDITNMLTGLKEIHNSRCIKLYDVFESMVKDKCFTNNETPLDYRGVPLDDDEKYDYPKSEDEDAMQGKFWPSEEIEEY